jgi:sporulation protein YlmC with PRC-barrel domain
MDLFRDLLDAELLDRHQRRIGRVDGIVLEIREGTPPRVTSMQVDAGIMADRIHPRAGRAVRAMLARVFGIRKDGASIPMDTIRDIGVDVEVDIDAEQQPDLLQTEKAARRLIRRIPGGAP